MLNLIKPRALLPGDTVAAVSLSWGGAGEPELLWRYNLGKERLNTLFGLRVVEMKNTLKGAQYLYDHPEKRAEDLMQAFADPTIRAVFSCIGGEESIRMLPYVDFDVIRSNPKALVGYSDTTIAHLMCVKAGVSSFYGPSILAELAENHAVFAYTAEHLKKALFFAAPIGKIPPAPEWTGERVEWTQENRHIRKSLLPNTGYKFLQGGGVAQGRLIGGCIEVLEMAKGTILWPDAQAFDGAALFFETSEDMPEPRYIAYWLRNYGAQGILQKASAILFGKPYQGKYYDEYKSAILTVLAELNLFDLPVVYNMSFGHNQPMCTLPYGALCAVDCGNRSVSIPEAGADPA